MKCFSEEEQEELKAINERMDELDPDKSEREREIITKLEEPEESEELEKSIYRRPTRRVMSTMAALGMFASSCLGSGRGKPYVCDYERVNVKGEPGTYNKSKHLSRAQRKRLKQKSLKKKS